MCRGPVLCPPNNALQKRRPSIAVLDRAIRTNGTKLPSSIRVMTRQDALFASRGLTGHRKKRSLRQFVLQGRGDVETIRRGIWTNTIRIHGVAQVADSPVIHARAVFFFVVLETLG